MNFIKLVNWYFLIINGYLLRNAILQGFSLVLIQNKERDYLVAFGGTKKEPSDQVEDRKQILTKVSRKKDMIRFLTATAHVYFSG